MEAKTPEDAPLALANDEFKTMLDQRIRHDQPCEASEHPPRW